MDMSFTFNGGVEFKVLPKNEAEKQILALAFNGNEVKGIKHGEDGAVILKLASSDATRPDGKDER